MPVVAIHRYIKSLPLHMQDQIRAMIRRGESAPRIAQIVQEVWGENKDVERPTMVKAIQRYGWDFCKESAVEALIESGSLDAITEVAKKVDVLDGMYRLVAYQQRRLNRALVIEDRHNVAGVNGTMQIKLMNDLLVNIAKIQIEIGVLPRAGKNAALPPPSNMEEVFRFTPEQANVLEAIRRETSPGESEVYDTRR